MPTILNLSPGDVFEERYCIKSRLGLGGMGVVYRAWQIDAGRDVAIKIIHAEKFTDEEDKERFFRECKILAKMSHAHIMTIYGLAVSREEKIPYALCEYIDGVSLRGLLCEKVKLPWARTLRIALQICDAMQYVHSHGIIHRDLKPENIMLVAKPEPDWVKVLDFGLAKSTTANTQQGITFTGQLIGSIHYMSPEQCRGQGIDARTDVYALGCIIFECVSGDRLFDAESALGVLHKHVHEDLHQRLQQLPESSPKVLVDVLAKCLSKHPDQRFSSMKELEQAIRSVLGEEQMDSALVYKEALVSKEPALKTTRPQLAGAALVAVLGLVAIMILGFFQFNKMQATVSAVSGVKPAFNSAGLTLKRMSLLLSSGRDSELEEIGETWLKTHPETERRPTMEILSLLVDTYEKQENLLAAYKCQLQLVKVLTETEQAKNTMLLKQVNALMRLGKLEGDIGKKRQRLVSELTSEKLPSKAFAPEYLELHSIDEAKIGSEQETLKVALNLLLKSNRKDEEVAHLKAVSLIRLACLEAAGGNLNLAHEHALEALPFATTGGKHNDCLASCIFAIADLEDADSAHKRLLAYLESTFVDELGQKDNLRSDVQKPGDQHSTDGRWKEMIYKRYEEKQNVSHSCSGAEVLDRIAILELTRLHNPNLAYMHLLEELKLLRLTKRRDAQGLLLLGSCLSKMVSCKSKTELVLSYAREVDHLLALPLFEKCPEALEMRIAANLEMATQAHERLHDTNLEMQCYLTAIGLCNKSTIAMLSTQRAYAAIQSSINLFIKSGSLENAETLINVCQKSKWIELTAPAERINWSIYLGDIAAKRKSISAAIECFQRAKEEMLRGVPTTHVSQDKRSYGSNLHPDIEIIILVKLSNCYVLQGKYEAVEASLKRYFGITVKKQLNSQELENEYAQVADHCSNRRSSSTDWEIEALRTLSDALDGRHKNEEGRASLKAALKLARKQHRSDLVSKILQKMSLWK